MDCLRRKNTAGLTSFDSLVCHIGSSPFASDMRRVYFAAFNCGKPYLFPIIATSLHALFNYRKLHLLPAVFPKEVS